MNSTTNLPNPNSDEIKTLLSDDWTRHIYGILYRNRKSPLTIDEIIRKHQFPDDMKRDAFARRIKTIEKHFEINRSKDGRTTLFQIVEPDATDEEDIATNEVTTSSEQDALSSSNRIGTTNQSEFVEERRFASPNIRRGAMLTSAAVLIGVSGTVAAIGMRFRNR